MTNLARAAGRGDQTVIAILMLKFYLVLFHVVSIRPATNARDYSTNDNLRRRRDET